MSKAGCCVQCHLSSLYGDSMMQGRVLRLSSMPSPTKETIPKARESRQPCWLWNLAWDLPLPS